MRRNEEDAWIIQMAAEEDGAFIAGRTYGNPPIEPQV